MEQINHEVEERLPIPYHLDEAQRAAPRRCQHPRFQLLDEIGLKRIRASLLKPEDARRARPQLGGVPISEGVPRVVRLLVHRHGCPQPFE